MANGDEKYRSRKWRLAKASLIIVTVFVGYALAALAEDAGDAALILGVWTGSDGAILGLYSHFNVKEKGG